MLSPPGVIVCLTGAAIQLVLTYYDLPKLPHFDQQVFVQILTTMTTVNIDKWGRKWWDRKTHSVSATTGNIHGDAFLVGALAYFIQIICMLSEETMRYDTKICKVLVPSILACTTIDAVTRIRNKRRPLQANEQVESESEMLDSFRKADGESL